MKHKLKIVTINMCTEFPERKPALLDKWIFVLSQIKADIIFLQEMESFNIERLANSLGLKILTIHQYEATSVLLNPNKLTIVDNNTVKLLNSRKEPFYIGGLHLTDIPSVTHHLNHIVYKSSETIPLSSSVDKILKLCVKNRVPRVAEELLKTKTFSRAVIAGDFNEPSHLDLDKVDVPVSKLFEIHGFEDTYWVANQKGKKEDGYTWPASSMYKKEPDQRIDMIYTKNMKVVRSVVYEGSNSIKWISDHKMVITDVEI
jgi:endonuclease/exonuclease/phosphatase family metal-dependent hydrolase